MRRGEVWWVARPGEGHRPHVILSRDTAIPLLTSVLAAPATRTIRGLPTEVELGPDDGMPDHCVVSLDNVRTIKRDAFEERICTLGPERMASVCRALGIATGCTV